MSLSESKDQAKQFKQLCREVIAYLALLEVEMLKPQSPERGQRIAALSNKLELANDIALRFGLRLERKGAKLRKVARP